MTAIEQNQGINSEINLRGKVEFFRSAVNAMLEEHGSEAMGSLNMGVMQMVGGQCQLALTEFDRAVAEAPDNYRPYYYRGTALMKLERYGDAVADLDRALELHPELGMAYLERALCYQELGEVDRAERDLQSALMISASHIEGFAQAMGIVRARCFDVEALMEGELSGHRLTPDEVDQVLEPLN